MQLNITTRTTHRRSWLRGALAGLAAVMALSAATPALAETPVPDGTRETDVIDVFVDVLPTCEQGSPPYTFTTTTNKVVRWTETGEARINGTVVQTGTFSAEPLANPALPNYAGTVTLRNSFYLRSGELVTTSFTYTVHGTGSDGSSFTTHVTSHANVRPDATINEFFRCH